MMINNINKYSKISLKKGEEENVRNVQKIVKKRHNDDYNDQSKSNN